MPKKTEKLIKDKDGSGKKKSNPEKSRKQQAKTTDERKKKLEQANIVKEFAKSTSNVVQQAAAILEEEIAAGIVAAKKVEKRLITFNELHTDRSDGLIQRFRRDAHELVDIFLDLVGAATEYIGKLAQSEISSQNTENQEDSKNKSTGKIETLVVPQSIKAGKSSELTLTVENESDRLTKKFNFISTDLVNASGDRIPAGHITFMPPSITIVPSKTENVLLTINIPKDTPSGEYSGLIQSKKLNPFTAILMIQVD